MNGEQKFRRGIEYRIQNSGIWLATGADTDTVPTPNPELRTRNSEP
jgi:hypothetical protein